VGVQPAIKRASAKHGMVRNKTRLMGKIKSGQPHRVQATPGAI
jgi:hypothetical protein